MENAVKALIMVAGLIVGVLVVGILVYLFRLGGNVASNYDQSMTEGEIASFNAKFEPYMTTLIINDKYKAPDVGQYKNLIVQKSNTIHDIVSVINLAYDINAKLNSNNNEDGISIVVACGSDGSYYMNAGVLYDYFQQTLSATNKKRKKNIVFSKENPPVNGNIIELNNLIMGYSKSVLLDGTYNERIYEYYFDCTETEYTSRGRIKKMKFERVKTNDKKPIGMEEFQFN